MHAKTLLHTGTLQCAGHTTAQDDSTLLYDQLQLTVVQSYQTLECMQVFGNTLVIQQNTIFSEVTMEAEIVLKTFARDFYNLPFIEGSE